MIEYVLDGENLIVQVPCSELEYPIDIVNDEVKGDIPSRIHKYT